MSRTACISALILLSLLPAAAGAQEAAYRGIGLSVSHLADDPEQTDYQVFGTSDLQFGDWFGLQGDAGVQYISAHHDTRTAAWIDVHPYLRAGRGLSIGGYVKGWAASDSAGAGGIEIAWRGESGFSAEAYLGRFWGDEMNDDGHATTKGARLGYEFVNGLSTTLYFAKDSAHDSGDEDGDYYDYGIGLDMPLGAAERTRVAVGLGRTRFDADDRSEARLSLALTYQFGGSETRPTFSRQRSVLADLEGY